MYLPFLKSLIYILICRQIFCNFQIPPNFSIYQRRINSQNYLSSKRNMKTLPSQKNLFSVCRILKGKNRLLEFLLFASTIKIPYVLHFISSLFRNTTFPLNTSVLQLGFWMDFRGLIPKKGNDLSVDKVLT